MKSTTHILAVLIVLGFLTHAACAQEVSPYSSEMMLRFRIGAQGIQPGVHYTDEEMQNIRETYIPPVEPNLPKVKYIKQDPPRNLRERVDRLLEGIKTDIPPEYDHYGYELRRYMAHVAAPDAFANRDRLKAEATNVKNANIVFTYWRTEMLKEMKAIEKEIETQNAPSSVRTTFNFNQGVVQAFMVECQAWIQKNKEMLEFLEEAEGQYTFETPDFKFDNFAALSRFSALYKASEEARKYINEYVPFSQMVY